MLPETTRPEARYPVNIPLAFIDAIVVPEAFFHSCTVTLPDKVGVTNILFAFTAP